MQNTEAPKQSILCELYNKFIGEPRARQIVHENDPTYGAGELYFEYGLEALMRVDPQKSTQFVEIILGHDPSYPVTQRLMHQLMDAAEGHNGKKPLPKNVLHWILPIAQALGNDENNTFNLSSREIEDFFACFPYPEVRSYLIDPIIHSVQRQGEKKALGELVSVRVVKVKAESFHLQHTYRAHYNLVRPVLTGLVRSLNAMGKYSGSPDVLYGDIVGDIEIDSPNPNALPVETALHYSLMYGQISVKEFLEGMDAIKSQTTMLKGELHIGEKVIKGRLVTNLEKNLEKKGIADDQWTSYLICDDTGKRIKLSDSSVQTGLEAFQMAIHNGFIAEVG
jgi:hypothetical protein